jgi:hypothetical protein
MIEFISYGYWNRSSLMLDALPVMIQSSAIWGMRKAAEQLVKIVRGHIDRQDLGWPPIVGESGDPRILVDTELYRNSIQSFKKGNTYYAGVPENLTYPTTGVLVSDVAMMHEEGYGNLPRRPLWRPSIQELGGEYGYAAIVAGAIWEKLQVLRSSGMEVKLDPKVQAFIKKYR